VRAAVLADVDQRLLHHARDFAAGARRQVDAIELRNEPGLDAGLVLETA
jgi:hypothetical protein